jgi:hypothetical protein
MTSSGACTTTLKENQAMTYQSLNPATVAAEAPV